MYLILLPLWFSVTVGWGAWSVFAVWCKTIKYQDNISNSIYDSQESTPTRTRNIQISWDLNQKLKLVKQEKSLSGIYRWKCVCLLFQESRWWLIWCYPVCFLLGWYLQLSPLARTLRGARRESSEQLLLESSLITAQCSAFLLRVHHTSHQRTRWHWVTQPRTPALLTPTTYTDLSRESPDPDTRYPPEYAN